MGAAEIFLKHGHDVTIFERDKKPGGLLNIIPEERFDRHHIANMVNKIVELGAKIVYNHVIQLHNLQHLHREFDYIFVATGTQRQRKPDVMPAGAHMFAVEYLESSITAKSVAVCGGGNVAMDCAVEAIKRGANSTIYYRKGRENMRAHTHEILHAEKAGVQFVFNTEIPPNGKHDLAVIAIGTEPEIPQSAVHDKIFVVGDAKIGASSIALAVKNAKDTARELCHKLQHHG
jgi:formate dehydrogenase beta subunit